MMTGVGLFASRLESVGIE